MRFRRTKTEPCLSCERPIARNQKVCACGSATPHMSFDERRAYEVTQWQAHLRRAAS